MTLIADHYYGPAATGYEAKRAHKSGWAREQAAVTAFLTRGPVIDVPFGTGRYVPIYRAKGLAFSGIDLSRDMIAEAFKNHGADMDVRQGTIFDLPFDDGAFGTAVCSRLLNWLMPDDMALALGELRRVAGEIIVSVRHGPDEGKPQGRGNYTHDLAKFLACLDGLFIADRREMGRAPDGVFEMFHLRPAVWGDVAAQFRWHHDGQDAITRLTRVWCQRYGIEPVDLSRGTVRAEYWTDKQLHDLVHHMASFPRIGGEKNRMLTDQKPRHETGVVVVFRTQGHTAMIDGRKRSNLWMKRPGRYPVLVVTAEP